jgi:hypothetical protein
MSRIANHICAVEKIKGAKETAGNGDRGEGYVGPLGTPGPMAIEPARAGGHPVDWRRTELYFSLTRRGLAVGKGFAKVDLGHGWD